MCYFVHQKLFGEENSGAFEKYTATTKRHRCYAVADVPCFWMDHLNLIGDHGKQEIITR